MSRFNQGWRAAGLLFPIFSLPTPFGVGDLGPSALKFGDFVKACGGSFWQILPLSPTSPELGNSPYSGFSAFAGYELLVSPEFMVEDGFLAPGDIKGLKIAPSGTIDYPSVIKLKGALVDKAFEKLGSSLLDRSDFNDFAYSNGTWLNDYAFFMVAKEHFNGAQWSSWPNNLKYRENSALAEYGTKLATPILRIKFGQFLFFSHLARVKEHLRELGISLIGDAAFYVSHDSADVWAGQHLFCLGHDGQTALMAGVPPDYYSKTGQLWGNPIYDWVRHRQTNYDWWKSRIFHNLGNYDWVRLDHFRAFLASWAVAAGEKDAIKGTWRPGPGAELFDQLGASKPFKILAEDLGIITPDVTALRKQYEMPGTRVLQFGVGDAKGLSIHCPFRIEPDNAVYTSTHDSDTARGWFSKELTPKSQNVLSETVGYKVSDSNVAETLVRLAWLSPAALALTTIQDLLALDSEHRINFPGTPKGNWAWKLTDFSALTDQVAASLNELSSLAGRDNMYHPNILSYDTPFTS
jgi:4-alpha-glucanotransferase